MPYSFGDSSETRLLKNESHKLNHACPVEDNAAIITLSADLVTSNVINGTVNGVAISQVTFATDHATTMGLLAAAIAALTGVATAVVFGTGSRKIKLVTADNAVPITEITLVVTLGASQATITPTYNINRFVLGQPVVLNTDGTATPAQPEATAQQIIGFAKGPAQEDEEVTVEMKAFAIIFAECETNSLLAGPVRIGSSAVYNATTGYVLIDDASVTSTNQLGWALEGGNDGDIVRVALL